MKTTNPIESNVIPQIGGLTELTGRFAQEFNSDVVMKGLGKTLFHLGLGTDIAATLLDCARAKSLKQLLQDAGEGLAPVLASLPFDEINPVVGAAVTLTVATAEAIVRSESRHDYTAESQSFASSLGMETNGGIAN
jgi:hypothetical protein